VDFAFSEEQEMLRSSARELMQARYPIERVAAIVDGDGFDRAEWAAVGEVGWCGISVPEEHGGAGLGFLEELVVAEELGRAVYPGPFFSTVILALPALLAAGGSDLLRSVVTGRRTATLAWAGPEGTFDTDPPPKVTWNGGRLTAERLFVPSLGVSDLVVVVGEGASGPGFWVLDRDGEGVTWRELATVDSTRPMGEVVVQEAPATLLEPITAAARVLKDIRDRALAALAAEAVAVGSAALQLAIDHAKGRQQFGRPIGAFQAVAHELAQAFLEVETARSLVYWAGWAVAEGAPEAATAAALAKARAGEAAVRACERAIQAHGGVGFTWEHPLHRFYKRALGIGANLASAPELRRRVAAELLD
jgi:alkylation response protein AidB-like acyl-CoA dehydrogenase